MEKRRAQLSQLKQAKAQGKLAYNRPNGSTNGLREHEDLFTLSDNK